MRRFTIALLAALLFVGFHGTQHVFAITYAAGWNLVAGPEGSHLSGATGSIFTLQPGDTDYEVFAADSPLRGGYGYWAFFPSGGSITLAGGSNTFSVASIPGQFIMVGNPSQAVVTVSGADTAFTYTPSGGYQNATAIPPGQGAWVMGSQIDLAGSGPTSAPVTSAPAVAPLNISSSPVIGGLNSFAGLRSVALQAGDVPGLSLSEEFQGTPKPPAIAQYFGEWDPPAGTGNSLFGVFNILNATTSVTDADALMRDLADRPRRAGNECGSDSYDAPGLGDAAIVRSVLVCADTSEYYDAYFRRGPIVVSVSILYTVQGVGSISWAITLARIIDDRLAGRSASSAPASTVAPAVAAQPTSHIFTASGSGDNDTANFSLSSSAVNICAQVSGTSPSGSYGPDVSVFMEKPDGSSGLASADFTTSGCKLLHPSGVPGRFYLKIIATPWSNRSITVDATSTSSLPLSDAVLRDMASLNELMGSSGR